MRGYIVRNIALSVLLMVFVNVCAQTNGNDSTFVISEVEVKGVSFRNDLHTLAPQYTVSSADFQRLNVSDLTSALRRLPGITLRDYGGAGGMKTVSVRGLGSQHTGVAIDGLLLPDTQSGQIDLQQFQLSEISTLTLNIAGDGDIFQSARNLSRASLLNISSSDSIGTSVSMEMGNWGWFSPSARAGRRIGNAVLTLQGGYTSAENDYPYTVRNGVATHREHRTNSALSQGNINASLLWNIGADATLKSFVHLFDNDRELPGLVRLYTNENDETLRDRGALVLSQITTRLSRSVWLKSALRWNWSQQLYHNGIPSGGIKSEEFIQREYYATSALLYQPTRHLDFDYSLDIFHNAMTTTLAANPEPRRTSFLQSVSGKWKSDRLSLVAQTLNSNIDSEHHLSPSLSASYRPFKQQNLMLRLAVKDIFRMPSMTELYYYHIGSQALKPEKTRQLNIGATYGASCGNLQGSFTCDTYINKVTDKIVAIPFNMFVWRYINVSEVLGRGADATLNIAYQICQTGTIALSANYSYQRVGLQKTAVERFEDNQIAYTPEHSGSASLSWLNPWVNISTTLTAASAQWTNNEHNGDAVPAYREVAASLYRSFRMGSRQSIDASLVVQNLFNYEYCLIAHYPMPGRNVKMKITYKF